MTDEAIEDTRHHANDAVVWGWTPTPGIVSVWADRTGQAVVWQRMGNAIRCWRDQFRPWIVATTLADVQELHPVWVTDATDVDLPVSYRVLDGPDGSYRYLLSAPPGYPLERAILAGATRRLGPQVTRLADLRPTYYRVGPVEQYLMRGLPTKGSSLPICARSSAHATPASLKIIMCLGSICRFFNSARRSLASHSHLGVRTHRACACRS